MASLNPVPLTFPAIVCMESSGTLWQRLNNLQNGHPLRSEFILTRTSDSPSEVLAVCRRLTPALVVIDEEQLQRLPLAGLRELMGPNGIRILLLSEKTDQSALEYFFRQGCAGVLSQNAPDQTLLKALRSMFSGEFWLPRALMSKIAQDSFYAKPASALTRRESEILSLVSDGHTNQEIADRCFISRETVRWHIRSIYSKIGVDCREEAVREAKRLQLAGSDAV